MERTLNLSIPTPCTEKWENFEPRPDGGFCSTCSKTVVDLSRMSDEQIIDFFRNKPAHTCGRLRADQLRSYAWTDPVKIYPGFTLFRAGLLSLFLLLASKAAFAQQVVTKQNTEVVQDTVGAKAEKIVVRPDSFVVSGLIQDEQQQPMPGVNIILKGTSTGTTTDADGQFTFPRRLSSGGTLIISFIGYETQEYIVPWTFNDKTVVTMVPAEDEVAIMGGVCAQSRVQRWWWKIKSIF